MIWTFVFLATFTSVVGVEFVPGFDYLRACQMRHGSDPASGLDLPDLGDRA